MVREIVISIYLLGFKLLFLIFNQLPLKKKATFVVSYTDNSLYVYKEMKRQNVPYEVAFLCKGSCFFEIKKEVTENVITFESLKPIDFIKSIYHLATSQYVFVDNYFGFLSAIHLKKDVHCIQLWHAAGAIKTFGLVDQSISTRSKRAQKRFLKVYNQFHKVVVGSDQMAHIFMKAFNLTETNILKTGVPRTDFFYENTLKKNDKYLRASNNKKIILYAPTFRDDQLDHFELKLDLDYMYQELRNDYVLFIKLHPAIQNKIKDNIKYKDFLFDYSMDKNINELLLVADYLISDYSSIPFEYALLEKPMIFFPYDLEEYMIERGLWIPYDEMVPGPIVYNTKDLVQHIKHNQFDIDVIRKFSEMWNKYSKGNSSEKLVQTLFKEDEQKQYRFERL